TGDVSSAQRALDGFPEDTKSFLNSPGPRGYGAPTDLVVRIVGMAAYLDLIERHFPDAFHALEKGVYDDRGRLPGVALRMLAGQPGAAESAGEEALPLFEARFKERPDDTFATTELSWVYLALGRNADALRLSRQASHLMPLEKDALSGPSFQLSLAQIEARAG